MRPRIYNMAMNKKPAELFRKDLISAMKLADTEQLNREDYLLIVDTWKPEWEKGVQVPVNPESLSSAPAYTCINASAASSTTSASSSSSSASSSYTTNEEFKMPKKLMKVEIDSDVYASSYDLDLMDLCWLNALKVSNERIEISEKNLTLIINQLEIQCATNMKAKHVGIEYDDHILCDVCRSPDAEDNNEMVFCDNCNICVHQACYGITSIPSGEWLCKPCKELGSQKNVSCVLCPNVGGALKPTTQPGKWAHVCCALWIPEVSFECVDQMEPITKVKQIPQFRKNLLCSICGIKKGAPVQCSVNACKTAYHITCAFKEKLKMKAIVEPEQSGVKLKSFCGKHSAEEQINSNVIGDSTRQNEIDLFRSCDYEDYEQSHCEFWKYIDIGEIHKEFIPLLQNEHPDKSMQQLQLYIDLILQYWKMKRFSRYGAPLIKLTTNASIEEIQQQQRNHILRLRVDLERIRNLSYMLIKREKMKKSWMQTHKQVVETALKVANESDQLAISNSKDSLKLVTSSPNSKLAKLKHEEETNLLLKTIKLHNIYAEPGKLEASFRSVIKRLNRLSRTDPSVDSLNRPNPYAKPYAQTRRPDIHVPKSTDSIDPSFVGQHSNTPTDNNTQKLPLRNKAIPSNSKNSTSNSGRRDIDCDLVNAKSKLGIGTLVGSEKSISNVNQHLDDVGTPTRKIFDEKKRHRNAHTDNSVGKNLRSSAFKPRRSLSVVKAALAQENLRSHASRNVARRLNFDLDFYRNNKKSSSLSSSPRKTISTRSSQIRLN